MLYLGRVQKQEPSNQIGLQLLAGKNYDNTWAILAEETVLMLALDDAIDRLNLPAHFLNEGVLVLADIGENGKVVQVRSATNWVLELVDKYLTTGFTPDFLQQEAQKAEEWRQSLSLQSQELSRRSIEVESRREQIQNIEAKLQQEKQFLEEALAELKTDSQSGKSESIK